MLAPHGVKTMRIDRKAVEDAVRRIIIALGENPEREGLRDTPKRVAKALEEIVEGYWMDVEPVLFSEEADLVIVAGMPFASLCEHHLLPFMGVAHVAYIPRGTVLGVSKIARIVRKYARRLQLQERLTRQIMTEVSKAANTDSVMVVTEAIHTCMIVRGVRSPSTLIAVTYMGEFKRNDSLVDRVLRLIEPYRLRIPLTFSS